MIRLLILTASLITSTVTAGPYNRADWPHWADLDHDCQNTRAETLIATSTIPAILDGCRVIAGQWIGPYTGTTFTNTSKMDIDHIVPLAEAHASGAEHWTRDQRHAFANDPENLLPTSASANRSKGKKDPAQWLPPLQTYHCEYAARWWLIKAKYQLTIDPTERLAVTKILLNC